MRRGWVEAAYGNSLCKDNRLQLLGTILRCPPAGSGLAAPLHSRLACHLPWQAYPNCDHLAAVIRATGSWTAGTHDFLLSRHALAPALSLDSHHTLAAPAQLQSCPQPLQIVLDIITATDGLDAAANVV